MIFVLRDARGVEQLWARFDRAVQERRPDREILPFALALPVNQATWDRIATAGPELDRGYQLRLRSFLVPRDEDFHVVVDKYLAVGRGRAALEMIGARQDINVPPADILRVLRDPSTVKVGGDGDRNMLPYYVGCVFKRLDADETVSEDELVGLEWTYFNALQHSDRPARTLHKALSSQPKFFVKLLSAVFASNE